MPVDFPLDFEPDHRPPEEVPEKPLLFAFRGRDLLLDADGRLPSVDQIDAQDIDAVRTQYLGRLGDRHCYSAELDDDEPEPRGFAFRDLRMAFGTLAPDVHAVASRAVQIVDWDRSHQYCGRCGGATEQNDTDRSRHCPGCKIPFYPKLSPAMIVRVLKGDEILLARANNFPPGIYSVLAGFVEPGESVEEAVVREVWEETRIVVDDVQYYASQPWPYPNSLMLGFTARYKAGEIDTRHDAEIDDAGWFKATELPGVFPGRISISQWLLYDWVEEQTGSQKDG
jgi:NAD+ diphosphatase